MALSALLLLLAFVASPASAATVKGKQFDRIIIVPLENTYLGDVLKDPYFKGLSQSSSARLYGQYVANTHPSQPNYMTMVAGDFFGVQDDDNHVVSHQCSIDDCDYFNTATIVDLLDEKSISWKVYVENYPGSLPVSKLAGKNVQDVGCSDQSMANGMDCYSSGGCYFGAFSAPDSASNQTTGIDVRLYARKHVPFLSFDSYVYNPARCAKIVDEKVFSADLANGTLPQYVYYVPNQCNDGHGTHTDWACPNPAVNVSAFVKSFQNKLWSKLGSNSKTVVIYVYDENDYASARNQVYAVAYGPGLVSPGPVVTCPKSGCPYSRNEYLAIVEACYNVTGKSSPSHGIYTTGGYTVGVLGKGTDGYCPTSYTPQELAAPLYPVNGLKADTNVYSHFSILTLVKQNWDLSLLWQGGESAMPLALN